MQFSCARKSWCWWCLWSSSPVKQAAAMAFGWEVAPRARWGTSSRSTLPRERAGAQAGQVLGIYWLQTWHAFFPGISNFSYLLLLYLARGLKESPVGVAWLWYLYSSFDWFDRSFTGLKPDWAVFSAAKHEIREKDKVSFSVACFFFVAVC